MFLLPSEKYKDYVKNVYIIYKDLYGKNLTNLDKTTKCYLVVLRT